MLISVNNQQVQILAGSSLKSVLLSQTTEGTPFAVAINGDFVPRSEYNALVLNEGDELDIVNPVGGG